MASLTVTVKDATGHAHHVHCLFDLTSTTGSFISADLAHHLGFSLDDEDDDAAAFTPAQHLTWQPSFASSQMLLGSETDVPEATVRLGWTYEGVDGEFYLDFQVAYGADVELRIGPHDMVRERILSRLGIGMPPPKYDRHRDRDEVLRATIADMGTKVAYAVDGPEKRVAEEALQFAELNYRLFEWEGNEERRRRAGAAGGSRRERAMRRLGLRRH